MNAPAEIVPNLETIRAAAKRIAPYAHRTPIFTCATLDEMTGARLYFKCENLQKVGAFKFRGACNAVFSLTDAEASRGVVTHSSGNHAQALALAAKLRGIAARIVMPQNAPQVKKDAVAGYGAEITFCRPTLEARERETARIIDETGAALVHPYDDYRIIAGQGTAALELIEDQPDLDVVMTPVGGGGLLGGTCLAAYGLNAKIRIIAGEPAGADDAFRSLAAGHIIPSTNPKTIADGLLTSVGKRNFGILREHVERIVTVTDDEIRAAMRLVWERMKLVIEPSAAVPLACLTSGKLDLRGTRVGIILSGGNVDLTNFFDR